MTHHAAVRVSLSSAVYSLDYLRGIAVAVIENRTDARFVCSDNPVVLYNQLLEQNKVVGGITGIGQKGLQIFVPLGPKKGLVLYDSTTYKVGKRGEATVIVDQRRDVLELNRLQILSAESCIYFGEGVSASDCAEIEEISRTHRRSEKSSVTTVAARDSNGEVFGLVRVSSQDIKCGLELSFVKMQRRARRFRPGPSAWIPRNRKVDRLARKRWAEWEARDRKLESR